MLVQLFFVLYSRARLRPGPPGGGEVPQEKIGRGVRPASQNPYPNYDQNLRISLPYIYDPTKNLIRVLTNTCYDADANQLLKELGWENLETRRQKLKAEMVYKSLNGLAPNYLSSRFIQRSDVITAYNLRDSDGKLAIPLPRTNYYKNSFGYSGAVLWNSLPSAARQATSLTSFRRLVTTRHLCKTGFNLVYFFNS